MTYKGWMRRLHYLAISESHQSLSNSMLPKNLKFNNVTDVVVRSKQAINSTGLKQTCCISLVI